MPWKPAKPLTDLRANLTDRALSMPKAWQIAEITDLLGLPDRSDRRMGKPYMPDGENDRLYMSGFHSVCKQHTDEAYKAWKPYSRLLLFTLTSSSQCSKIMSLASESFDAIAVSAGLVELIHRDASKLATHALEAGLHQTRCVARSLVNRLGHSHDTVATLAAFIAEMGIGLVAEREIARIGTGHAANAPADADSREALELDLDIQAIHAMTRRAEGDGRLGTLLAGLLGVPFFDWLKEEPSRGVWLTSLAIALVALLSFDRSNDPSPERFSRRMCVALEVQARMAQARHPHPGFSIRDVQDEALSALALCIGHDVTDRAVRTPMHPDSVAGAFARQYTRASREGKARLVLGSINVDRHDPDERLKIDARLSQLGGAWNEYRASHLSDIRYPKGSLVDWWRDAGQAFDPAGRIGREQSAATAAAG